MSFTVIIPSANAANLIPCVRALREREPELSPERILVIDDGARATAEVELPGVRWLDGIKPFVFARNVNRGIGATDGDVILLNDDARLITPHGFNRLAAMIRQHPKAGIVSAAIRGVVGNANQVARDPERWRAEPKSLAFVCVYMTRTLIQQIGNLDERFVGYGFEDNDYCRRALAGGFELAVWDGCLVNHDGKLPSTYRSRHNLPMLLDGNRRLFDSKWNAGKMQTRPSVDLLYLACNRLEFTQETFETLIRNTDWEHVQTVFVIDDGSTDGTGEYLRRSLGRVPKPTQFLQTRFGSPVTAMVEFIRRSRAPILAKTDNDAMLPPGWLRQSLDVLSRHPELALLGIEAMYPVETDPSVARYYAPAEFISGLGLYRRAAFNRSQPRAYNKWFGLEEWQQRQGSALKRGWIMPAIPVFLLDRIPFAPWSEFSDRYIQRGWQRSWPKYDAASTFWQWRWPDSGAAEPAVTTTSSRSGPLAIGALRIKNEAPHIRDVIERMLPLCERVFVLDDHSTDETLAICESFGDRTIRIRSAFEGLDEARDKNFLLAKLIEVDPEWVLWIDGDEILENAGPDALRAAIARAQGVAAFSLRIAYVWNSPEQIRVDGIYGNFRRPSLFRLRGQPTEALRFPATGFGANLHCGNVPQGLVGTIAPLEVRLKHLGYMKQDRRMAKYRWYTKVDPNNEAEDNYRHLVELPGALYAPGPARFVTWSE
jgi:glycosyltransferase involved in cell wall biosynthesis